MRRLYTCSFWSLRKLFLWGLLLLFSVWIIFFIFFHESPEQTPSLYNTTENTDIIASTAKLIVTTTLPSASSYVPLVLIFTQADRNPLLLVRLIRCLQSIIVGYTPVNVIFISDKKSFELAEAAIKRNVTSDKAKIRLSLLALQDALALYRDTVDRIKEYPRWNGSSAYSQTAFLRSILMHRILPFHSRVIYVDVDVVFQEDISLLYKQFANFSEDNLIGLAYEQQPFYRHPMQAHRTLHLNTSLGSPQPDGHPGFNGGVILFDLDRMRRQKTFQNAVLAESVIDLVDRYTVPRTPLQDQDIFTLLSFEHPKWFYVLPCEWNRRICIRRESGESKDVFKAYHACQKRAMIYHGNCNTRIPVSVFNGSTI